MEYMPGPWTAEGERIHSHAPPGAQLGLHIATVHVVDGLRATLDANAKLIAAAPAMLEALEAIIKSNFQHGMVKVTPEMFAIIAKARAAIEAAKGLTCGRCGLPQQAGVHYPNSVDEPCPAKGDA